MDWYYIEGTEPRGPHELDDLLELAQSGTITPHTLVWNQHLPSWQSFSDTAPPPAPEQKEATEKPEIEPPASGEKIWYFLHGTAPYGPVSLEALHTFAEEGIINGDSPVWQPALPGWEPFSVTLEEELHPEPPPITQTTLISTPEIAPDTEWFYIVRSEPDGPVNLKTLHKLYHLGTIQPHTLIWHHGSEGWLPYRDVLAPPESDFQLPEFFDGTEAKPAPPADLTPSTYGELPSLPSQLNAARRKNRSRHFGPDSPPAGFFIRVAAYTIDAILVHLIAFGIGSALVGFTSITWRALLGSTYRATPGLRTPGLPSAEAPIAISADLLSIITIAAIALSLFYYVFLVSLYGATPGKRFFRYHIADQSGKKIGLGRATARHIGGIAIRLIWAGIALLLGLITSSQITPVALAGIALLPFGELTYLWAIWDKQKRALHDHLAGTYILRD